MANSIFIVPSLQTSDGSVALPGFAFALEPSTGFVRSAAGQVDLSILGVSPYRWTANAQTLAAKLLFSPDNTYDIGAAGATRPANAYIANNMIAGGGVQVGSGSTLSFTARTRFDSASDGVLSIANNAATKTLTLDVTGITAAAVLTVASAQTTSQTLTIPVTRQAETLAIRPQISTTLSTPQNPAGTISTAGVMMGLARTITPQVTGQVFVCVNGNIANGTGGDGAKVELRMGTGAAPSNGGALAGTVYGGQQTYTVVVGATDSVPFSLGVIVTGLTVGTVYWIDVDLAAITGGTATITNVSTSAFEL